MSIMSTIKAAIARVIARAIAPHITAALPASENKEIKAEIDSLKGEIERLALHSRDEEEIIRIFNEALDLEEAFDDHGLITGWEATEIATGAISEWSKNDLSYEAGELGFLKEADVLEIITDEIRSEISSQLKEEISAEISSQLKKERLKRFELKAETSAEISDLKAEISELKAELRAEIDRPWWRRLF